MPGSAPGGPWRSGCYQPSRRGLAAAEALSNGAVRHPVAAPPPGALLPGLSSPQQEQNREQQQHQDGADDRGHGRWCGGPYILPVQIRNRNGLCHAAQPQPAATADRRVQRRRHLVRLCIRQRRCSITQRLPRRILIPGAHRCMAQQERP